MWILLAHALTRWFSLVNLSLFIWLLAQLELNGERKSIIIIVFRSHTNQILRIMPGAQGSWERDTICFQCFSPTSFQEPRNLSCNSLSFHPPLTHPHHSTSTGRGACEAWGRRSPPDNPWILGSLVEPITVLFNRVRATWGSWVKMCTQRGLMTVLWNQLLNVAYCSAQLPILL